MASQLHCSFCKKSRHQVEKLVAGPSGVYICDRCVNAASQIMDASGPPPQRRSLLRRIVRTVRARLTARGIVRRVAAAAT